MPEQKTKIKAPGRAEKSALRIMILLGIFSMFFMVAWILRPVHVGYPPLYWLIIITLGYALLRVLHEWYHYFFISVASQPELNQHY